MRFFAGIELDDPTRAVCVDAQARLQQAAFGAKYDGADKLHVTLAFLGNVRAEQLEDVERVLRAAADATKPFDLALDRVGAFPNERRPRIVYVGSRSQSPHFRTLAHRLHDAYRDLGFDFKEDPVAHITIARIKGGSGEPLPLLDLSPHHMPIRTIALFESIPAETTTRYTIHTRRPLSRAE